MRHQKVMLMYIADHVKYESVRLKLFQQHTSEYRVLTIHSVLNYNSN